MGFNNFFSNFKCKINVALGLNELSPGNKRFLLTHLNFMLFTTIPGVFISTFFFRQTGKISTVITFAAVNCFVAALTMQFSSVVAIKKSPVFVMRVGIILFNVLYISLLILQHRASNFVFVFGIISGISNGFYWQSYNSLLKKFTHNGDFNRTLSIVGLSNSAVQLVVPTFSGIIITRIGGSFGYTVIFLLAFVFSVVTTIQSTRIPVFKLNDKPNLRKTYIKILKTPKWNLLFISEFFRGLREIAFPTFLNIIFFKYIQNEALLGLNTMACGIAAIISFYLSGTIIKPNNRIKFTAIASSVLFVVYLLVFIKINAIIILALSIVNAFMVTYIGNPAVGALYGMYEGEHDDINFAQYMAAHELFLAFGRVLGCVIMIELTMSAKNYPYALLILNATAFLGLGFLYLAQRAKNSEIQALSSDEH